MKIAGKYWFLRACILSILGILSLSSCAQGKHPFLMVQACLENDSGVEQFKRELQDVARHEGMRYIDGSRATERDLKALGVFKHPDGKFVHVGLVSDNGIGLEAGNLGLNTYDVAVGFNGDHGSQSDLEFSERVLARLKQLWQLKVVPEGSGALPDSRCVEATDAT